VLSQRAAIAGLRARKDWFPAINALQRQNQAKIKATVDRIPGLSVPVYPSNGNFLVVECIAAGVRPEVLVAALQEHRILIRQGAYHTPNFGHRFIKVSTTVPEAWVSEFCALLPGRVEAARGKNELVKLF